MRTCLTELRAEPFAAEREWTVEGIPMLTAAVELPQPQGADAVSRRIRRYYQAQCKAFLRYCERWLFPQAEAEYRAALAASAPLPCFRAKLGYRVTYNSGGLWSLYTQSREVTGHTLLTRRGDTWDLAAGYPVPLSAFFPARSLWRRQLLALAAEDIQRQERAGIARYDPEWRKKLRRFNSRNYYLTEEGLTYFFPMYAIAPAAEAIPAFTLPYGQRDLLPPSEHRK